MRSRRSEDSPTDSGFAVASSCADAVTARIKMHTSIDRLSLRFMAGDTPLAAKSMQGEIEIARGDSTTNPRGAVRTPRNRKAALCRRQRIIVFILGSATGFLDYGTRIWLHLQGLGSEH